MERTEKPIPVQAQELNRPIARADLGVLQTLAAGRPRDLERIEKTALFEAKRLAERAYYAWEVKDRKSGKKYPVFGPSIHLANALLRIWGNSLVTCEVTEDEVDHWTFTATFIDVETMTVVQRPYIQYKTYHDAYGQERGLQIAFQVGVSKATRDVVLRALPGWLIDEALNAAKEAAVGDKLSSAKDRVIQAFQRLQVSKEMLEKYLGKKRRQWTDEDIAHLRGVWARIHDRESTVQEIFGPSEADVPTVQVSAEQPEQQSEYAKRKEQLFDIATNVYKLKHDQIVAMAKDLRYNLDRLSEDQLKNLLGELRSRAEVGELL